MMFSPISSFPGYFHRMRKQFGCVVLYQDGAQASFNLL